MPDITPSAPFGRLDPEHFWRPGAGQQVAGYGEEPVTQPVYIGQYGRIDLLCTAQTQQQALTATGQGSHQGGIALC